jgi:hypothetical protein
MPAATAEKRARQRANKLKMSATTESESTHSASVSQTPPSPPFNFNFFIQKADIIAIHDFLAAVSQTTDGQNLKLLWKRAFEEGRNHGLDEGMFKCSEDYARGLEAGSEMRTTYFDAGRKQGIEEGEERGREVECQVWLSSGHGIGQCTPTSEPRSFTSIALQTDNPLFTLTHSTAQSCTAVSTQTSTISQSDASVQATEPPLSPSQPQNLKAITALDWAEDANSLPITPLPPLLRQPRDLSVLRSQSSSAPFSSLQHRSKRFTCYSHQSRRRHSRFNFTSFNSPHHNSFKPSQPSFYTKTPYQKFEPVISHQASHLNWESDPRLSDLSRSLKALGWIRAH